jgi:hypothetical protein
MKTLSFSEQGAEESIWAQDGARSGIRENFIKRVFIVF